jgi:hypothetical protein
MKKKKHGHDLYAKDLAKQDHVSLKEYQVLGQNILSEKIEGLKKRFRRRKE